MGGCADLEMQIYRRTYNNKNISFWEGILVLKWKYTGETTITKKYFTLGGHAGLEMQIYSRSYNNKKIFHFGTVYWS